MTMRLYVRLLEGEVAASLLDLSQTRSQASDVSTTGSAGDEAGDGAAAGMLNQSHINCYLRSLLLVVF